MFGGNGHDTAVNPVKGGAHRENAKAIAAWARFEEAKVRNRAVILDGERHFKCGQSIVAWQRAA